MHARYHCLLGARSSFPRQFPPLGAPAPKSTRQCRRLAAPVNLDNSATVQVLPTNSKSRPGWNDALYHLSKLVWLCVLAILGSSMSGFARPSLCAGTQPSTPSAVLPVLPPTHAFAHCRPIDTDVRCRVVVVYFHAAVGRKDSHRGTCRCAILLFVELTYNMGFKRLEL